MNEKTFLIKAFNLLKSGNYSGAEKNFKKVIKLNPKNIFALNNLGNLFVLKKNYKDAIIIFDQALKLKSNFIEAIVNKSNCFSKLGKHEEALKNLKIAIKLKPDLVDINYNLGNCLLSLKRYEEAINNFNKIIQSKVNFYMAIYNKAICLFKLNRFTEALDSFQKTLQIKPNFYEALNNLGNCLQRLNKFDEALKVYQKAISIKPDYVPANNNLGQLQLLLGNYKDGFKNYEWRKKNLETNKYKIFEDKIEWHGNQNIKGKNLFISSEQGIGDYIQFCRYFVELKKLKAKLILDTPESLIPLIKSMDIDFIHSKNLEKINFDYHCSIGSLPLAFGTTLKNIPNKTPYFFISDSEKFIWRQKLKKNTKNIGLKWTGNKLYWDDENRSTSLNKILDLFELPYDFHSLEIDYSDTDEMTVSNIKNLHCHKKELRGLDKTAAFIENLDLVITTDTSIAHLCGALNKPCWVMLSKLPNFRWLLDREDSPWYTSLKLYRQKTQGDWNEVVKNIKKHLILFF